MTVERQALALAAMIACGAVLGAAYDVLGLLRRALRAGPVLTGALDMLWGALGAAAAICVGLWLQIDLLRAYVLCGMLAGMGVYTLIVGLPVRRLARAVRAGVKKGEKDEKQEKEGRKTAN